MNNLNDKSKLSITEGKNYEMARAGKNFKVETNENINFYPRKAVIYFSSSGIYFPNSDEEFKKVIIDNDIYEFEKSELKIEAYKSIYVRDVAKQFYLEGISNEHDTIDKVIELLKEITVDCDEIITVGCSAGGYMAALVGSILNAKYAFSFSGFFDLYIADREAWYFIDRHLEDEWAYKYYKLREYIKNSEVKLIYFYPNKLEADVRQSQCIKGG